MSCGDFPICFLLMLPIVSIAIHSCWGQRNLGKMPLLILIRKFSFQACQKVSWSNQFCCFLYHTLLKYAAKFEHLNLTHWLSILNQLLNKGLHIDFIPKMLAFPRYIPQNLWKDQRGRESHHFLLPVVAKNWAASWSEGITVICDIFEFWPIPEKQKAKPFLCLSSLNYRIFWQLLCWDNSLMKFTTKMCGNEHRQGGQH